MTSEPSLIINYNEVLTYIENFMKDSKLRIFCEVYCKGECCEPLIKKCTTKCSYKKLSCSIYLCNNAVKAFLDRDTATKYFKLRSLIKNQLELLSKFLYKVDIYSDDVPQGVIDDFSMSKKVFFKYYPNKYEIEHIKARIEGCISFIERAHLLIRRSSK